FADDLPAAGAKASAPAQPDAVSSGLVPLAEADAWDRIVKRCLHWDVYHLAAYHRVAAVTDGGEPFLFWFEADGATACVPFLRRPIDPSLAGDRARFDASSAYGYPGPIASCSEAPNATWRGALQDHFRKALSDAGIVAAFIRHESRAADIWLVDGLGETLEAGPTVMLDLAGSDEDRAARLGQKHRYEVRRAERDGLRVVEASEDEDYEAFAGLYGATMERLGATAYYRFPLDYFFKLRDALGDHLRLLFTVDASGERLAGALFFLTPGIVQYHLSGRKAGPEATFAMRPLLDAGAKLGAGQGARWMHLGGGLGGRQDGLFAFKASVTGGRSRFLTTRWIVDPAGYAAICERAVRIRGGAGDPSFFPAYRAPVRKDP
ncbi:MAG TPA: peptidoglycan bridge formation glycyltransferase FemA/FemB family protein, partial [Holophagaceae bacterium]|nr:peptidoglycan bridge formation glycyltransferase FemA/FemB family protein [Holophagaceae bacterium]